jgi:hypothetical protein
MAKRNYEVGKGKPPKHSQFKPGQSGNPKGRPKGSKDFRAMVEKEAGETVSASFNGKPTKITKFTYLLKKAFAAASAKGDTNVILRLLEFVLKVLPAKQIEELSEALSEDDQELLSRHLETLHREKMNGVGD